MITRIGLSKVTIVKGDFSPRILSRYPEYICPRDICLKGHWSKGTFVQGDICPRGFSSKRICPRGFSSRGIFVQGRHLSKGTLVQGNFCPRRLLSKSHLVRVVLCIQQATRGEG